jgi:antitoxin (DNA-binding transcriptional repressor) of toxin-antitoxin stability system
VRAGETVLVTNRVEVVAELRPTCRRPATSASLDGILDSLADRAELTRATIAKGRWSWKAKGLGLPSGLVDHLLDEIRGDL